MCRPTARGSLASSTTEHTHGSNTPNGRTEPNRAETDTTNERTKSARKAPPRSAGVEKWRSGKVENWIDWRTGVHGSAYTVGPSRLQIHDCIACVIVAMLSLSLLSDEPNTVDTARTAHRTAKGGPTRARQSERKACLCSAPVLSFAYATTVVLLPYCHTAILTATCHCHCHSSCYCYCYCYRHIEYQRTHARTHAPLGGGEQTANRLVSIELEIDRRPLTAA